MDRTHDVSGGMGRSETNRRCSSSRGVGGSDIESREGQEITLRASDLYNLACGAKLLGETDSRLQNFIDSFEEPKRSSLTPKDPSNQQVNEYTVWLTVRGVQNGDRIVTNPNQPLTMSEAVDLYSKLSREFITCSHEESINTLDSLQDFLSLMLRYPMIPKLAMDTKECPECYFETEITLDTWEEVRSKIFCYHFTLRHENFPCGQNRTHDNEDNPRHFNIDNNCEMLTARPCDSVFITDTTNDNSDERESLKPFKFLHQLESLKRRDEIIKQKTLGREMFHRVKSYNHTLEELEAPRYISSYPLRLLYQFYGSLNTSRRRAQFLAEPYPAAVGDTLQARVNVEHLRMSLMATASTGYNDELMSYMCMAVIGPVRRYKQRYNFIVERVVLFKHLIASGFPIETSWSLLKTITASKRISMISLPLDRGVALQLKKTVQPTTYNRKIASLIWLLSHITAYCTLRQLNPGYVHMGDSPKDISFEGIYVFDNDHVGFRLSTIPESSGTTDVGSTRGEAASAYMPFSRVLELLALRDIVQERLCQ